MNKHNEAYEKSLNTPDHELAQLIREQNEANRQRLREAAAERASNPTKVNR